MDALPRDIPPGRRLFCNRTLNMRSIRAVGFDMDYTLVHYHTREWEEQAYEDTRKRLSLRGLDVEGLSFDPHLVRPGLVLDLELGNAVKPNRFGFVKQACHGSRMFGPEELRKVYAREIIDLSEKRWVFLDTWFALSEACLYLQLVDRLDEGRLGEQQGYSDLYRRLRECVDATHTEGILKEQIVRDPTRFVDVDEELPLALLDMKNAGKKLLLITNSEWFYTRAMLRHILDRFLPGDMTYRELFDVVIVGARKPAFFEENAPAFRVVDDETGLLSPHVGALVQGGAYFGGNARLIERSFGLRGEEILYVGDHIYADVHVSKNVLRWRTALITRELENELAALESFKPKQAVMSELMADKEALEHQFSMVRIALQRLELGYGPQKEDETVREMRQSMQAIRQALVALDQRIGDLAKQSSELGSVRWGLLMRAGNDKSRLAFQMERYADVYTSRVSNYLRYTPFVYLRSPRGSLPHDSGPEGGASNFHSWSGIPGPSDSSTAEK
ncbi:MAG: superfamily [Myxococcaceae bacterium]|nr:superfamily [Myxococcaceae bacterium]